MQGGLRNYRASGSPCVLIADLGNAAVALVPCRDTKLGREISRRGKALADADSRPEGDVTRGNVLVPGQLRSLTIFFTVLL